MEEQVIALKEQVHNTLQEYPQLLEWCDDDCCKRFLRARGNNLEQAHTMLHKALLWRVETQPDKKQCDYCLEDPFSHNMRLIGFDVQQRPVIYTCFRQAKNRFNPEVNVAHLIKILEETSAIMKLTNAEKWVWIIDFEGFGVSDCSITTASLTRQLLDYYPDRLGVCVLLDAPWLFYGLWKTILPILPTETANKIQFVYSKDSNQTFRAILGDEVAEWLSIEAQENRNPTSFGTKKYWEWFDDEGNLKSQDPRGCKSFVNSVHYKLPVDPKFCSSIKFSEVL